MARSYDEIMQPYRGGDASVQQVADAAKAHFEVAYDQVFGIGQRIAERRERAGNDGGEAPKGWMGCHPTRAGNQTARNPA